MRRVLCSTVLAILLALCLVGPALAVEYSSTDTPLAITDYTNTRSTITVTADQTITDVNVRINITHTYDSDLDIRLTGPSGQECWLASGADDSGDNFTNTVFDDEASVSIYSGSPPFTGSFIPHAALSVYDGSSTAGDWKLDVYDAYGGDTGNLVSWDIIFETSGPSGQYCSEDTPLPIRDYQNTRSAITITDDVTITDLNVRLSITHTWDFDLTIRLTGPSGEECYLTNRVGSGANFTNTVFDDEASIGIGSANPPFTGSFIPQAALSVFDGGSTAGTWYLDVYDNAYYDEGTLDGWCLIFNSVPPDETAPVITINSANPTTLWPPNGKNRTIELAGNICDAESALAVTRCVVEDEYGDCDGTYTLTCEEDGDFYYQLSLPAFRYEEDMDGRVFDVTIYAEDSCGNDASECIQIVVPHDMGRRNNQPPAPG